MFPIDGRITGTKAAILLVLLYVLKSSLSRAGFDFEQWEIECCSNRSAGLSFGVCYIKEKYLNSEKIKR